MWRLLEVWVVGFALPGYLAACAFLTLLALNGRDIEVVPFAVAGTLIWLAIIAATVLIVWGLNGQFGKTAWLARTGGWMILLAASIPFISVSFVTWPLLLTALPIVIPRRIRTGVPEARDFPALPL